MKSARISSFVLAPVMAIGLAACGGSPADQLADEQADLMDDMAAVIEGIENVEDLENSREDLRLLANQLMALGPKWKLMSDDELSDQDAATAMKGNKRLAVATKRYGVAMAKMASKPELMMRLSEIMQESAEMPDR